MNSLFYRDILLFDLLSKLLTLITHLNIYLSIGGIFTIPLFPPQAAAQPDPPQNSQPDPRSGANSSTPSNYIGVGGTIGWAGKSNALGTGGFSILTKNMLGELFSIDSNTVIFGSTVPVFTTALTLNFPIRDRLQNIIVTPFFGAGVLLRGDDSLGLDPLVMGGFDLPLSESLTGNLKVEAGFPNNGEANVGTSIGIGYNY
jgi:hypothetical protein